MSTIGKRIATPPEASRSSALARPLIVTTPDFGVLRDGRSVVHRHAIVACDCEASTAPPGFDRLSVRTMRRGSEVFRLGTRRVVLDEDACLVVNSGCDRTSAYVGDEGASPLVVAFRPGSLAQSMVAPDAEPGAADSAREDFAFLETLQPHGGALTHHLEQIERHLREGEGDALWWEERIALLLGAAIDAERALRRRESAMTGLKPATRRELLRRVLMASDYIQSTYDRPITLHDIAAAAHLSRFHLVRLFQMAHGLTPHAYLTRKRLRVALRLVSQTQLGLNDIAARAGLGTRSSLFRHLRRQQGSGALALRTRPKENTPCTTSA